MEYSFIRYLQAKVSVDNRALNQPVWNKMAGLLPEQAQTRPLRILEVGCGIGTMVERMVNRGLISFAEYTGIDQQVENIMHAAQNLPDWSNQAGYHATLRPDGSSLLRSRDRELKIEFFAQNLLDFVTKEENSGYWDLILAHAFLDLIDVPAILPPLLACLRQGGVFYFTLNFDGMTILEPQIDPGLDERIVRLYHQSMDRRQIDGRKSGDSQTGRHLFNHLHEAGASIIAAGASDWVVFPGKIGYPQDEAYFLHYLLHTMQEVLLEDGSLDRQIVHDWAETRHTQVDQNKLVYIAHQIDFVGII